MNNDLLPKSILVMTILPSNKTVIICMQLKNVHHFLLLAVVWYVTPNGAKQEVIVNGRRLGVTTKNQHKPEAR